MYNGGIEKWNKNADGTFGSYIGKVIDKNGDAIPGNGDETFGYDADNNIWYTGDRSRNIYSFDADVDTAWQVEFTYPNYGGGHHDGLEFVNGYLWVSDMTSDYIGQWEYTGTGSYNGWNEVDRFEYTYGKCVEGMGFGPLGHFWASSTNSWEIYEIGGGKLGVALTDIPDQTIPAGGSFVSFNLDDYAGGATGLAWTSSGASVLTVSIDSTTHVCTVTYPSGWTGSETITFTAICPVGNINSDDATFTVTTTGVTVESADSSGVKKDTFQLAESVYAIGSGYGASTTYDLYILNDQTWSGGESLAGAVVTTTVITDASGNIPAGTLIWASAVAGNYDIVVDVDGNVQYDASTDALDDMDVNDAGFEAIPEFPTVALPVAAIIGLMFLFQRRKD